MNYFVLFPDGQRFGPVSADVLTQWAAEGRLLPSMTVQDEVGHTMVASEVPGVIWTTPAAAGPPTQPSGYAGPATQHAQYPRFDQPRAAESWIDKQFINSSVVAIGLVSVCCALPMLILSLIAFLTTQNPIAKDKAKIGLIVSGIMFAISFVLQIAGAFAR